MPSDEKALEPINATLNPEPPRFGMPWYIILGILTLSAVVFLTPHGKICGLCLAPCALAFGAWLCRDDPKEPMLLVHDLLLPSEFDPGKS